MKFYKLTYGDNTPHNEMYKLLESIGGFVVDKNEILFYANRIKKTEFSKINADICEINPLVYKSGSNIANEWLISNFRKSNVEAILKKAELEKQEDLKNLYSVIKAAEEIIDRKEDLVE